MDPNAWFSILRCPYFRLLASACDPRAGFLGQVLGRIWPQSQRARTQIRSQITRAEGPGNSGPMFSPVAETSCGKIGAPEARPVDGEAVLARIVFLGLVQVCVPARPDRRCDGIDPAGSQGRVDVGTFAGAGGLHAGGF